MEPFFTLSSVVLNRGSEKEHFRMNGKETMNGKNQVEFLVVGCTTVYYKYKAFQLQKEYGIKFQVSARTPMHDKTTLI